MIINGFGGSSGGIDADSGWFNIATASVNGNVSVSVVNSGIATQAMAIGAIDYDALKKALYIRVVCDSFATSGSLTPSSNGTVVYFWTGAPTLYTTDGATWSRDYNLSNSGTAYAINDSILAGTSNNIYPLVTQYHVANTGYATLNGDAYVFAYSRVTSTGVNFLGYRNGVTNAILGVTDNFYVFAGASRALNQSVIYISGSWRLQGYGG